jgi:hypothetical protein
MKRKFLKYIFLFIVFGINNVCYAQDSGPDKAPKPDILDSLIAIAIILFILSVIVEKITQLIRKYSPFIKPKQKLGKTQLGTVWKNINKKQIGEDAELNKRVEREVNSLSFVIGLLIAFAFRVDLFKMLRADDPRDVLFWSENAKYNWLENTLFVLSIALTGFFLTFGSKFFHDLLDTLFQIKNLKRKVADENTYQAENIQQFDEYIEKSYSSLIETAIQQNQQALSSPDSTGPPMHGKMIKNGKLVDCIDIHVQGNDRKNIPYSVQVKLEKGQVITVPVNVIYQVSKPDALTAQGDTVANSGSSQFKGTVCCKLKRNADNRLSLLTCSHVMTGGKGENFFGTLSNEIAADISDSGKGKFFWALCNDRFDIALVEAIQNNFKYQITPSKERSVGPADILSTNIKVVRQQGRGISEGKIVNHRVLRSIMIQYSDGEFGIANLILLSNVTSSEEDTNYTTLTAPGDSGACVYDDQNRPIGMIIAGNNKFSYAIPIVDILSKTNSTLIS